MGFSESTRIEAKRRAHFQCVICKSPFVQVHHIKPQAAGGSDELDNAAPLCGSCHDQYGANPAKHKTIREMRDFWWEFCAKREAMLSMEAEFEKLDTLQEQFEAQSRDTQRTNATLEEIKTILDRLLNDKIKAVNLATNFAEIVRAAGNVALSAGSYHTRGRSRHRGSALLPFGEMSVSVSISKVNPSHCELLWDPQATVRARFNSDGTALVFSSKDPHGPRRGEQVDYEIVEEHD